MYLKERYILIEEARKNFVWIKRRRNSRMAIVTTTIFDSCLGIEMFNVVRTTNSVN